MRNYIGWARGQRYWHAATRRTSGDNYNTLCGTSVSQGFMECEPGPSQERCSRCEGVIAHGARKFVGATLGDSASAKPWICPVCGAGVAPWKAEHCVIQVRISAKSFMEEHDDPELTA